MEYKKYWWVVALFVILSILTGSKYIYAEDTGNKTETASPSNATKDEFKLADKQAQLVNADEKRYKVSLIIAGHNYRKHFSKIKWLPLNSKLYFTTIDGTKYVYDVTFIEEINEQEVEKIYNGDWDLTLFTCSNDNSKRTVVRCKLTKDGGNTNEG